MGKVNKFLPDDPTHSSVECWEGYLVDKDSAHWWRLHTVYVLRKNWPHRYSVAVPCSALHGLSFLRGAPHWRAGCSLNALDLCLEHRRDLRNIYEQIYV